MLLFYALATIGFILSLYGLYIERTAKEGKKFWCDLSKNISCTKAFTSKEGHMLKVPNSVLGLLFYPLVMILFFTSINNILLGLTFLAAAFSVYLAYSSLVHQKNICVVCTTIYLINVILYFMTM